VPHIDIFGFDTTKAIPLADLPKHLQTRNDRPTARSTVFRWAARGLKSNSGQLVRLKTFRVGGIRCTTDVHVEAFFNALEARVEPTSPATPPRKKLIEEAERRLRYRGL